MTSGALALKHPEKLFIGGEWVRGSTGKLLDVLASHDETVVYQVAEADEADLTRAVAAARQAFDHGPWPRLTHRERGVWMQKIAALLEQRADEFARIWTLESGVLYKTAQERVGKALSGPFRFYAGLAESFAFRERHKSASGMEAMLVREPVGVVAEILPWNVPAGLMAQKTAPALLAGCTLVIKPSPEAPGAAYLLAEICEQIDLPAGVINVLMADRVASAGLVRNPGIDKVTFTGSTAAGRAIAKVCGDRIARFTLELGGKSPAVVLDDYDIQAAARTIAAGCRFLTGQVCHSLTRIIVSRDRHDAMTEALAAEVGAMRVGDPFDPATDVGPLASSRQRDTVESFIAGAVAEGAKLAVGGKRPAHLARGYYIEPTIFGHVDNRSTIGQQEVFGPVLSVIAANDERHAVMLANDTIFGLNAAVFTNDGDRFISVARELRSGTVGQNASRPDVGIGFGGFKHNLVPDDAYPCASPTGMRFESLSHHAALDKLLALMNHDALRAEQASFRERGIHRGIGFASFVEVTNPSAAFYGVGGARISSQDGVALRLDAAGTIVCQTSVTEQGQGAEAVTAQVVATALGVKLADVRVISGDTDATPYGGGTWASRAAGIGGEAAWQAGKQLRLNILDVAASILQAQPPDLDIRDGRVVDAGTDTERLTLAELARITYFRPDTLPPGFQAELMATKHYVPRAYPFAFTNGIQASYLEIDTGTGMIRLLGHWVIEDCGTILNPQLVDEQVRGGVVQGLGAALFEHCRYDDRGQMLNASMADYLVPMAAEMPDIGVGHVVSPTADSELGAKGAGEAGTAGAAAAVANAVNDALAPFGVAVTEIPLTPEVILSALNRV